MYRKEIRLSGSGGQGVILMGIILAEAAILQGYNSIQSQSYGPEARGGASKAEVIISSKIINYPKVQKADILLSLTQEAFDKYGKDIDKYGIVILDSSIKYNPINDIKIYSIPIIQKTRNKYNELLTLNMVSLGVLNKIANLLEDKYIKEAILKRVPKGTKSINVDSYNYGKIIN